MGSFPRPAPESIIYDADKLYVCLASFPITRGHTIVVWKEPVRDINLLQRQDYEYLMDVVDEVRASLLKVLGVEKVYLLYMDEVQHVHWHLIPRFEESGFNVLLHEAKEINDFSLASEIKRTLDG
ncbi:MAG: HIT family protein [bacterium]|nr:HIT family protein [bacterium]